MPPEIEARLRELELAMPDDLDKRIRGLEKDVALLPEIHRQLQALQSTLNTFAGEGKANGEHINGVLQRLLTLENEHTRCFKSSGGTKDIITQIGEWAIKLAAIGGLAYAAKEGFLK
jgi:hypothetical protein